MPLRQSFCLLHLSLWQWTSWVWGLQIVIQPVNPLWSLYQHNSLLQSLLMPMSFLWNLFQPFQFSPETSPDLESTPESAPIREPSESTPETAPTWEPSDYTLELYFTLPLLHQACLVGESSFPAISSTWLHRYYLNWTELDNAITKFNNEMHSAEK